MNISKSKHTAFQAVITCAFLLALMLGSLYAAEVYRYVDDKGKVNLTDSMQNVPEKYRDKVKMIKESELPGTVTPFFNAPEKAEETAKKKKEEGILNRFVERSKEITKGKGLKGALFGLGALVILFIVIRFVTRLVVRIIIAIIAIIAIIFMGIYFFKPDTLKGKVESFAKERKGDANKIIKKIH